MGDKKCVVAKGETNFFFCSVDKETSETHEQSHEGSSMNRAHWENEMTCLPGCKAAVRNDFGPILTERESFYLGKLPVRNHI